MYTAITLINSELYSTETTDLAHLTYCWCSTTNNWVQNSAEANHTSLELFT